MKQFDLQGNEYDCNIEFPTDITDVSFRFSKDALFKSWQDEALRHREEILQLKDQLQQKENIIKEVREDISEIIDYIYQHGFYYDSDEGAVPNELGMYEIAHITGELKKLINEKENK